MTSKSLETAVLANQLTNSRKVRKINPHKAPQSELDFLLCLKGQIDSDSLDARAKSARMVDRRIETVRRDNEQNQTRD